MSRPYAFAVLVLLAAVPLALAHDPAGGGGIAGTPKTYCEDTVGDTNIHEYAPPASGITLFLPEDGAFPPCPYQFAWDGHYEWAQGGAYLLACESACGLLGTGGGASLCWETYADHPVIPRIAVFDIGLTVSGFPVTFYVFADVITLVPPLNPAEPDCGDFLADSGATCVNACQPLFGPGSDGSYLVYVEGTAGHIVTY